MRNGRMIMKISATVLELIEAYCDHCAIRIQTIAPFATTLELAIDEHISAGFLAAEWHSTFQPGPEIDIAVDFDNTPTGTATCRGRGCEKDWFRVVPI